MPIPSPYNSIYTNPAPSDRSGTGKKHKLAMTKIPTKDSPPQPGFSSINVSNECNHECKYRFRNIKSKQTNVIVIIMNMIMSDLQIICRFRGDIRCRQGGRRGDVKQQHGDCMCALQMRTTSRRRQLLQKPNLVLPVV
mmetsp:Transcript_18242/g.25914  ORF Transcript_18242/g.25914 Transcript_18242/m.25914 type:complete len:138 (+) Transcript_18242:1468-1881(+)